MEFSGLPVRKNSGMALRVRSVVAEPVDSMRRIARGFSRFVPCFER